jgi:membrane protein DedA with SNARE-associated domain
VWAVAYTLVGYVFGRYWSDLLTVAKSFGYGILVLVILVLVVFLIRGYRGRTKEREDD